MRKTSKPTRRLPLVGITVECKGTTGSLFNNLFTPSREVTSRHMAVTVVKQKQT